jgi:hypothetical protein
MKSIDSLVLYKRIGSSEMNENNTSALPDSGSPSQLMTTSLTGGRSQSNLFAAIAVGRFRSSSLRRVNDHRKRFFDHYILV